MVKKYQLSIRMWVKQSGFFNSPQEAYEVGRKVASEENISVLPVEIEEMDIEEKIAKFQGRAAEFKREMQKLGVDVQVSASFGVFTSTVEKDQGK